MERMGDILARAANRRANVQRTRHFDGAGTNGSRSSSVSKIQQATNGQASQPIQRLRSTGGGSQIQRLPSANAPHPVVNPLPDAQPAPAGTPAADVLDSDRILELPARRQPPAANAYTQRAPRMNNSRPRISTGMQSLREATQEYLAGMPQQRMSDAAAAQATGTKSKNGSSGKHAVPSDICPICHGAGYVRLDVPLGDPAFGQAVRCECKERQIADRDRGTLRRLSNLDPFRDKTFEKFDAAVPGVREAFDVALHYAEDPMGWLVFGGGYGGGKTHLAAAIANACEQAGVPVIFAIVPDLLDHLRAAFAPNSETTYDALFDKIREVQLLVLDDLGAENSTAWATEKLFQLINYRYNYRMPTVITTNHRLLTH
ncbi:MAG TPA: ATP-binding protein, partial [Ktedonobacterales bacterium]|nr:ATP-binding protein [Ktedonobacterales bacterium]